MAFSTKYDPSLQNHSKHVSMFYFDASGLKRCSTWYSENNNNEKHREMEGYLNL